MTLLRERRCLIAELQQANNELEAKVRARTWELQEKNIALEEMNTLKNEVLGMAAHDLRSPIGNIHNLAELILDDDGEMGQEERAEIVTMICNLSQGMMNLLNDLLDITTIESGKIDLQPTPVAMRPYLRETEHYHRLLAERKKIHLITEVADNLPLVVFDQQRIRQVLNNLLSNAIKFSPMHTVVQLRVYRHPGRHRIFGDRSRPGDSLRGTEPALRRVPAHQRQTYRRRAQHRAGLEHLQEDRRVAWW